jgi:hypothetical protein
VALRVQADVRLRTSVTLGALLAALTLTRTVGLFVAAIVAVILLLQRVDGRKLLAALAVFAIPVLSYGLAFQSAYGVFGLQGYSGRYLYGMVAPYAKCSGDEIHDAGRVLCPRLPTYARPGLNQYVWQSSDYARLNGDDIQKSSAAGRFARRTMMDQPGATVGAVARNFAHYFVPGRDVGVRDWFAGSWQFPLPDRSPAWNISPADVGFHGDAEHGAIRAGPARFLRGAQNVLYTPGPLLLAATLFVIAALVRRRGAPAVLHGVAALAGTGLLLLVVPSATAGFDWRYLLPAQALLVPAGVLAARSLLTEVTIRRPGWMSRWRIPAAAVAVAAVVATLVASPSVYAEQRLRPGAASTIPSTAAVAPSLDVHVGRPAIDDTGCTYTGTGYRMAATAAFPIAATHHGNGAALVQPADFGVVGADPSQTVLVGDPELSKPLPSAVLSSRYPRSEGRLYLRLFTTNGRLVYIDPRGAGAAAWTFRLPAGAATAHVGEACKPPPPPLPAAPRLARIAPFTTATQQVVTFGPPNRLPLTGTTYDVRWLSRTPVQHASAWHLPRGWQHSEVQSLTLSNLHAGVTYCFSARAHRPTGRTTAWSVPRCATRLADDSTLSAVGRWQRFTGRSGFYGATYTATRQVGATLTSVGRGQRLAVVAYRCPGCGAIDVLINGRRVHRLDLDSSPAVKGVFTWTSRRYHRAGNVMLRASGSGLVLVDAIGVQP